MRLKNTIKYLLAVLAFSLLSSCAVSYCKIEANDKCKLPEYEEFDLIEDTHVAVLKDLKEQARAERRLTRKVSVDPELKSFKFTDINVNPGGLYVYKIVPVNQGGVEGNVRDLIRVRFRGEASEIRLLTQNSIDDLESEPL